MSIIDDHASIADGLKRIAEEMAARDKQPDDSKPSVNPNDEMRKHLYQMYGIPIDGDGAVDLMCGWVHGQVRKADWSSGLVTAASHRYGERFCIPRTPVEYGDDVLIDTVKWECYKLPPPRAPQPIGIDPATGMMVFNCYHWPFDKADETARTIELELDEVDGAIAALLSGYDDRPPCMNCGLQYCAGHEPPVTSDGRVEWTKLKDAEEEPKMTYAEWASMYFGGKG